MTTHRGRGRRRRRFLAGAAGALVLALTAGCTDAAVRVHDATRDGAPADRTAAEQAPAPELRRYYEQRPAWGTCDTGGDPDLEPGDFQCARLTVPLSYDRPAGETITIAVTRARATGGGTREGSLLINPGGPGASGVEAAWWMRDELSREIRARFDIVGFDPRGVERSAPVTCVDDRMRDRFTVVDGTPDTGEELQKLDTINRAVTVACERSGELFRQVGTRNAARDMDVLRAVLGDRRLNYVGFSYGTYLGALYAEQFPARAGRLVLDGAVDPAMETVADLEENAKGFTTAFTAYAESCLADRAAARCPFTGRTLDAARAEIRQIADSLDAAPIPVSGGRQVDGDLMLSLVLQLLYSTDSWHVIGDVVEGARRRDGASIIRYNDVLEERDPDGRYRNNQPGAHMAVLCADGAGAALPLETVRTLADRFAAQYPPFGRMLAWSAYGGCPAGAPAKRPALNVDRAVAPMLVVGTTRDPATPLAAAERLTAQLPNARLLTYDGDGHTAYLGDSTCVRQAVDAYLLGGTLPPAGKRC